MTLSDSDDTPTQLRDSSQQSPKNPLPTESDTAYYPGDGTATSAEAKQADEKSTSTSIGNFQDLEIFPVRVPRAAESYPLHPQGGVG